jgi:hypothetical protein
MSRFPSIDTSAGTGVDDGAPLSNPVRRFALFAFGLKEASGEEKAWPTIAM